MFFKDRHEIKIKSTNNCTFWEIQIKKDSARTFQDFMKKIFANEEFIFVYLDEKNLFLVLSLEQRETERE